MAKLRVVCFSGGHSSALVAIEVVRRFGAGGVVLLNHDIHPSVEGADIKRFKQAVADYLSLDITYANHPNWDTMDQFDVVREAGAFKVGSGAALCTHRLKTKPFQEWLAANAPTENTVIYYGFDAKEKTRIQRRIGVLSGMGYRSDYPLALWGDRTIFSTREVGIEPPHTYGVFKHANCTGCLKAGIQHWYIVYCTRPELWQKAKDAEEDIGYSILKAGFLENLEPRFAALKAAGVETTEHESGQAFGARSRKILPIVQEDERPCECVF